MDDFIFIPIKNILHRYFDLLLNQVCLKVFFVSGKLLEYLKSIVVHLQNVTDAQIKILKL